MSFIKEKFLAYDYNKDSKHCLNLFMDQLKQSSIPFVIDKLEDDFYVGLSGLSDLKLRFQSSSGDIYPGLCDGVTSKCWVITDVIGPLYSSYYFTETEFVSIDDSCLIVSVRPQSYPTRQFIIIASKMVTFSGKEYPSIIAVGDSGLKGGSFSSFSVEDVVNYDTELVAPIFYGGDVSKFSSSNQYVVRPVFFQHISRSEGPKRSGYIHRKDFLCQIYLNGVQQQISQGTTVTVNGIPYRSLGRFAGLWLAYRCD